MLEHVKLVASVAWAIAKLVAQYFLLAFFVASMAMLGFATAQSLLGLLGY